MPPVLEGCHADRLHSTHYRVAESRQRWSRSRVRCTAAPTRLSKGSLGTLKELWLLQRPMWNIGRRTPSEAALEGSTRAFLKLTQRQQRTMNQPVLGIRIHRHERRLLDRDPSEFH